MVVSSHKSIQIAGGGVAGLTAAIQLKKAGFDPVIFEKESKVGGGRHGDYEGLDNWIFSRNVPTFFKQSAFKFNELTTYPISRFFVHTLFGKPITIQNNQPFFYMVKRGSGINDLDYQLYRQCKEIGVRFELGKKAPETCHIIATGSRKAAAYIRGINFKTTLKNQVHLLLGSQFAPKGYAYLIIINGNGTLATAFKNRKILWLILSKTHGHILMRQEYRCRTKFPLEVAAVFLCLLVPCFRHIKLVKQVDIRIIYSDLESGCP